MVGEKIVNPNVANARQGIGFSVILYLIYATYYISGYSSRNHNYVIIGLFAIWIFMALIEDIKSFDMALKNKTVIWCVLFVFYYFFTSLAYGDIVNTMEYIARYIMLFACVFQYKYYTARNRVGELKLVAVSTLIVWVFFAIKAIAFYISVPSAARILASDFYAFDNVAIGGGYAIAFGSAILCVFLFEQLINKRVFKNSLKLLFFAYVIVLFYLLIKTESTLTLIACSVGMIISVTKKMWRHDGKNNNLKILFLTILYISIFIAVLVNFQEIGEWIVEVTKGGVDNVITRRFNRIGEKMAYSATGLTRSNYVDERWGYVVQSWNTFCNNPIIGIGLKSGNIFSNLQSNGFGAHSAVFDLLAQHGILGSIPFIMFFITGLRKECKVRYNSYIATLLFMAVVNPLEYFHVYVAIFTLIPIIDILIERFKSAKSSFKNESDTI